MKKFSKIISAFLFCMFFQLVYLSAFSPLKEIKGVAEKAKQKASDTIDKVQDKVENVGDKIQDKAKSVAVTVSNKVEDIGHDIEKNLKKLGISNPKEFVNFAFKKMPTKLIKKLAKELFNFAMDIGADAEKTAAPALKALEDLYEPIPPLPTDIPLPLPSTPPGLPTFVNTAIKMSQSIAIGRLQKESLAYLIAFHSVTNYKYFSEQDRKFFLAEPKKKTGKSYLTKVISDEQIDLKLQSAVKTARKPIEILRKILEKLEPKLFRESEPISNSIDPVPLMAILPLGNSFNGGLFCFRIKNHRAHFKNIKWSLENDLKPLTSSDYVTLAELRKNPMMSVVLKIVEKNPIKNIKPIQEMNELFVDKLYDLPWGMHSKIIIFLQLLNFVSSILDTTTSLVVKGVVDAASFGAAAGVSEAIGTVASRVINANFAFEFINTMFKWAYIRYIDMRLNYLDRLIDKARADNNSFSSELFIKELNKIRSGLPPTNPIPGISKDASKDLSSAISTVAIPKPLQLNNNLILPKEIVTPKETSSPKEIIPSNTIEKQEDSKPKELDKKVETIEKTSSDNQIVNAKTPVFSISVSSETELGDLKKNVDKHDTEKNYYDYSKLESDKLNHSLKKPFGKVKKIIKKQKKHPRKKRSRLNKLKKSSKIAKKIIKKKIQKNITKFKKHRKPKKHRKSKK